MHHPQAPIGIYDSGLGGLSVLRQLWQKLPQESVIYVADTARVPYGGRSPEEIQRFSHEIIDFMIENGVKMIAVACNTSSVIVLPALKRYQGVPVLGLAQAGAQLPPTIRRVGLLATEATIRSQQYRRMLQLNHPFVELHELACPDFVPLVESGRWEGAEAHQLVAERLKPLQEKGLDGVILGCSHFPYLARAIRASLGEKVALLDPAERLVDKIAKELSQNRLLNTDPQPSTHVYTTAHPASFQPLAERYLEKELRHLRQSDLHGRLSQTPQQSPALLLPVSL